MSSLKQQILSGHQQKVEQFLSDKKNYWQPGAVVIKPEWRGRLEEELNENLAHSIATQSVSGLIEEQKKVFAEALGVVDPQQQELLVLKGIGKNWIVKEKSSILIPGRSYTSLKPHLYNGTKDLGECKASQDDSHRLCLSCSKPIEDDFGYIAIQGIEGVIYSYIQSPISQGKKSVIAIDTRHPHTLDQELSSMLSSGDYFYIGGNRFYGEEKNGVLRLYGDTTDPTLSNLRGLVTDSSPNKVFSYTISEHRGEIEVDINHPHSAWPNVFAVEERHIDNILQEMNYPSFAAGLERIFYGLNEVKLAVEQMQGEGWA